MLLYLKQLWPQQRRQSHRQQKTGDQPEELHHPTHQANPEADDRETDDEQPTDGLYYFEHEDDDDTGGGDGDL